MQATIFDQSINEILKFYESIGFKRADKPSDRTPAAALSPSERILQNHSGRIPNTEHPSFDSEILHEFFSTDVWYDDTECDVCEDNKVYEKVLPKWAAISHGVFKPKNISETWDGPEGAIAVECDIDGESYVFEPEYLDDYLSLDILDPINEVIAASGRAFEFDGGEQTVVVMCITAEQKEKMIVVRNFPFAERLAEMADELLNTPRYVETA